jgi:threonine/homoserine/homoserine lactone efflux protein
MLRTLTALLVLGLTTNLEPGTLVVFVTLLRTDQPRRNALAFLAGWFVSLAVVFVLAYSALDGRQPVSGSTEELALQIAEIVVGVLLLGVAVHEWRRRLSAAEPGRPRTARWLARVGPRTAFFVAMWEQPWTVTIAAGLVVVRAGPSVPESVAAFVVYACASSALVGSVWVVFRHDPERAERLLRGAEARVRTKGPRVIAAVCAVAAVAFLADGVWGLARTG